MRDRHDKRLHFSVLTFDCFPLDLLLFCIFHLFQSKWPFFVFLRNIHLKIEILKIETSRIFLLSFAALFCPQGLFSLIRVSPEGCAVPIWQNCTRDSIHRRAHTFAWERRHYHHRFDLLVPVQLSQLLPPPSRALRILISLIILLVLSLSFPIILSFYHFNHFIINFLFLSRAVFTFIIPGLLSRLSQFDHLVQ